MGLLALHSIFLSANDGNALVAAQRCCVREFVGVELDEEYLKVARERMAG